MVTFLFCGDSGTSVKSPRFRIKSPASAGLSFRAEDIDRYLHVANRDARDRIKLFRLAWDMACSGLAGRQVLYERFFFGDPIRMMSLLYRTYDKQPLMDQVNDFLARDD